MMGINNNMIMNYYYFYYLIIIIFSNSISVFCQKQEQRIYCELITEPTIFTPEYNRVISHAELPVVKNELSITLKLYLESHGPGRERATRTPALWLRSGDSAPCPRFSITGDFDAGINLNNYGFLLNRWYHIAYTLSNLDKRMNLYIDGKWVGSFSMTNIQGQSFIFNDSPLYIGRNFDWNGFTGQISNFRYYNFRLSHSEVLMDYSGVDPTKHNGNDECLNNSFVYLAMAFFLGIMVMILVGILFIPSIIIRRSYQAIPNSM
ncbi:concanavalin A-like lectin/glucanase domain-containing protein [Gigaspora rosea]|uniref:Concanavalin A-like lectin/glucanase domain-containing protein n=1 Tax=Gigaspora rosea TaxID=44941 RepID=A0A397VIV6_9GLOM|nr:concanavalin A-like lectin/glucanase domain-containing protein [Gigaspora rosea]CAG8473770.1 688_t:CDS:2 [Gigaspora rosea]